jgi:hypothetical protein
MTRTVLGTMVLIALTLIAAAGPAQAISIDVVPSTQTVDLGDVVSVALTISGLGDLTAPSLGTFDLDLSFDTGILGFVGATFGDPTLGDQLDLFGLGSLTAATPGAGGVNLFQLSLDTIEDLDTLQAGAFTLATLTFNTVGAGTSALGLSLNTLGDAAGAPLLATLGAGSVTVNRGAVPVPAPATLLSFGIGLAAVAGLARRGRRASR